MRAPSKLHEEPGHFKPHEGTHDHNSMRGGGHHDTGAGWEQIGIRMGEAPLGDHKPNCKDTFLLLVTRGIKYCFTASDFQAPKAITSSTENPAARAAEAPPILSECPEKFPSIPE